MNGRVSKLLRKVAKKNNQNSPHYRRALKRWWNTLSHNERTEERKKIEQEL